MQKQIKITIDCSEDCCGKCNYQTVPEYGGAFCDIFGYLEEYEDDNYLRCKECKEAEIK